MKLYLCCECRDRNESAYGVDIRVLYDAGECEVCGSYDAMRLYCHVDPPPAFASAEAAIDTWFRNAFPND